MIQILGEACMAFIVLACLAIPIFAIGYWADKRIDQDKGPLPVILAACIFIFLVFIVIATLDHAGFYE